MDFGFTVMFWVCLLIIVIFGYAGGSD